MLPFHVVFQPGQPIYEQVASSAKRAILGGKLVPGQRFPSVRELSQDLKINPNTAQKVIARLTQEGLLEIRPGIGSVVAELPTPSRQDIQELRHGLIEEATIEARRLGLSLDQFIEHVKKVWHGRG